MGRWKDREGKERGKGEEGGGEREGEKEVKEVGENLIACRANYDLSLSQ